MGLDILLLGLSISGEDRAAYYFGRLRPFEPPYLLVGNKYTRAILFLALKFSNRAIRVRPSERFGTRLTILI